MRRERRLPGGRQGDGEKTRLHEIPRRDGGRLDLDPEKRRSGGRDGGSEVEGGREGGGGREAGRRAGGMEAAREADGMEEEADEIGGDVETTTPKFPHK
jgi:hypothetical protein